MDSAVSAARLALDRDSPLPLYAQVKRRLQSLILAGEAPADRFFSEAQLCRLFDVSRATVRQAMAELVAEGWVRTEQGRGSFVNRDKCDEAFGPHMNFMDQWAQAGRPLLFELARFEVAPVPDGVDVSLQVDADEPCLCIERVRRTGDVTVSYDYRYIHPELAADIRPEEARSRSLLELLARRVRLVSGENRVEACLAHDEGARLLQVEPTDPMLVREVVYLCEGGMPAMAGRSLYRASEVRYRFSVDLTGSESDEASAARALPLRARLSVEPTPDVAADAATSTLPSPVAGA